MQLSKGFTDCDEFPILRTGPQDAGKYYKEAVDVNRRRVYLAGHAKLSGLLVSFSLTMYLSVGVALLTVAGLWSNPVIAQFPPTPQGITVLDSHLEEGVKISYKETDLCETTEGVKNYAGYIHLPADSLANLGVVNQSYQINTFFWFFESRKDPSNAPLAIWMNGGPGSSSLLGLLQENGPCRVNADSNSTYLNQWSWNNEVNMLYVEQPVQVGLSYDELVNVTVSSTNGDVEIADFSNGVPEQVCCFSLILPQT